ncbi:MAG: exonuclease SbcCD subunit D [Candidatus Dojkabacteria bacterium]
MAVKLIHTADVHIGAKLTFLGDKAEEQRAQIRQTFTNLVAAAISEGADLFLIAGDLFDSPFPSAVNIGFVITEIGKLIQAGIWVGIIPGNHDRLEPGSVFTRSDFSQLNATRFKLFNKTGGEAWAIPELELVVYGVPTVHQKTKKSPLTGINLKLAQQGKKGPMDPKYKIGLVHGSLDINQDDTNAPISKSEISKLVLNYLAVGDWHGAMEITQSPHPAWYSGSPEVIHSDQHNSGHYLLVEITESDTKVTPKHIGHRKTKRLEVDLAKYKDINALIKELDSFADPNVILSVSLGGSKNVGMDINLNELTALLSPKFFSVRLTDKSELEITKQQLEQYPPELITGRYIRLLQSKKGKDPEKNRVIDKAIQLGVKLLSKSER